MPSATEDPLRDFGDATRDEIQRAHDLLHAVLVGDVVGLFNMEQTHTVHVAHDVLCWVLGSPCGEVFKHVLTGAMRELRRGGARAWRNHPPA